MSASRREFIKGAALSGAAVAAMPALAMADEAAPAASGHWSWSNPPEPIADDQIGATYDCEICVVGLGSAGAPAAMYAATHGISTVVLQKGDHAISNGWCANAINNKVWLGQGGEPFDTTELYQGFSEVANGRDNGVLVKMFLDRGGEVMDWVLDNTTEIEPVVVELGQSLGWYENNDFQTRYARFASLIQLMADKAEEAGATMLYDTPACQLVTNETGDVVGAIGQTADGTYVKVNASKGVLLCTGDIIDDDEMLECFAPLLLGIPNLHGFKNNTGDGQKMASWIGAQITPAPHALMLHFDPTWLPEGNAPLSGIPWLRVNIDGKRFQNEDLPYQSCVMGVSMQPEQVAFQICDSHWMDHINDMPNPNSHSRENPDPEGNWAHFLETGAIKQADTLEELAEQYGINAENLVATVEHYNELVDAGKDTDYGMKYIAYTGIKEPPFYAVKRVPSVLATVGGVQIGEDLRVLGDDGAPIDGLYAAGDMAGSFYGHEYPMVLPGGSIGRGFIFGILSVKAAMGNLEEPVA